MDGRKLSLSPGLLTQPGLPVYSSEATGSPFLSPLHPLLSRSSGRSSSSRCLSVRKYEKRENKQETRVEGISHDDDDDDGFFFPCYEGNIVLYTYAQSPVSLSAHGGLLLVRVVPTHMQDACEPHNVCVYVHYMRARRSDIVVASAM